MLLFVEVATEQGLRRRGVPATQRRWPAPVHTPRRDRRGGARCGDPSDIDRIYQSLLWAGASVGRSGVATQAIAALDVTLWDLKARRAGCRWQSDWCAPGFLPCLQHVRRLPAGLSRGDQERPPHLESASAASKSGRTTRLEDRPGARGRAAEHLGKPPSWSTPTSSGIGPGHAGCAEASDAT